MAAGISPACAGHQGSVLHLALGILRFPSASAELDGCGPMSQGDWNISCNTMVFVIHVFDMLHMGINYLSDFTEMQKNGDGFCVPPRREAIPGLLFKDFHIG